MKKIMKYHKLIVVFALILVNACNSQPSNFQDDADIVRLNHLEYYGNLLGEYYDKTGTYPLMGEVDVPVYVFVASPEQVDDIRGGPPYAHKIADFKYLVEEFKTVLGRDIAEYYDPQFEPDGKPNFYIYMVDGNTYNFAVHTHQAYTFSNHISEGYNKIEITNNAIGGSHRVQPKTLFASEEFKTASSKTISKKAFFSDREAKFIHATQNIP